MQPKYRKDISRLKFHELYKILELICRKDLPRDIRRSQGPEFRIGDNMLKQLRM
jgi:hypothetical protein